MKRLGSMILTAITIILAPSALFAQFDALKFVELPAVGSWAEYQVTLRNETTRVVKSQKVSLLSRVTVGSEEIYWFQVEMESDEFGAKRVPIVTQLALTRADALSREGYFGKAREMIVQVGGAQAFRIAKDFIDVGIKKNMLTGGEKGAGSDVQYSFRDLDKETVKARFGDILAEHKKGLGRAEVVLSLTNPVPERFPVDVILDLWYAKEVPFGVVRQVTKQTGKGPQGGTVSAKIDTEEIVELVAYGVGAKSAVQGALVEYAPAKWSQLRPAAPSPTATPAK